MTKCPKLGKNMGDYSPESMCLSSWGFIKTWQLFKMAVSGITSMLALEKVNLGDLIGLRVGKPWA